MIVLWIFLLLLPVAHAFADQAFFVRDTAMVLRYGQAYSKFTPLSWQDFFTVHHARDNRVYDLETKMLFHVVKPMGTVTDVKIDSLPIIPFVPSCGNDSVVFYLEASRAWDAYEVKIEDFWRPAFFRSQPYTTVDEPNPHFFRMFSSLTRLQYNGDDTMVTKLNTELPEEWPYFILRFVVDNGGGMAIWDWPEQGIQHLVKGHMEGDSLDDLLDRGDWRIRLATPEEMVGYTGAFAKFRWQREIGALDHLRLNVSGPDGQSIVSCYLTMPFQSMLETGGTGYITIADEFLEEHPVVMLQFPNEEVAGWLGLSGDSLAGYFSR